MLPDVFKLKQILLFSKLGKGLKYDWLFEHSLSKGAIQLVQKLKLLKISKV